MKTFEYTITPPTDEELKAEKVAQIKKKTVRIAYNVAVVGIAIAQPIVRSAPSIIKTVAYHKSKPTI
jgi:hypothetical protein